MCGFAGIVSKRPVDPDREAVVRRMAASLVHRGPDGEGTASANGCDLAFRRLSIVDVAAACAPFANEDGSIETVCNGEIYNADELRAWLEARGHRLRTGVDTEVIPHLYEEVGPDFVRRLDGMFAFAVWDERRRILVAGRDRAGEKPLFYRCSGGELAFASELRALLEDPGTEREIDPVALRRYLLHDYVPAPYTPLAAVRKLPAGHVLTFADGRVAIRRYWDLAAWYEGPSSWRGGIDAAAEELDARIALAIRRRSRSDVPVGVFLSGGLDSSTVLAHLTEQAGRGVPAFSLGFADEDFDESAAAGDTADRLGAELDVLVLGEADFAEGLRRVGSGLDEPLGDASTIPTHLLSLHARRKVKVVLSGEGGDELFAGYPTYRGDGLAEAWGRVPGVARRWILGAARRLVPPGMGNVGLDYLLQRFAAAADKRRLERHVCWFGGLPPERHASVLAPRIQDALTGDDPFGSARAVLGGRRLRDPLSTLLYLDFSMYLQDDLLVKVDRASMLASLEARAPFLDHELAEWVAGLPSDVKLRGFTTKAVLRRAAARRLPRPVLHRRKRGFNIPFSRWLLHGLGDALRERFSPERVAARGLFSHRGIATLIDEHMSRRADHRRPLFSLLAFDLWCDRTFGETGAPAVAGSPTAALVDATPTS